MGNSFSVFSSSAIKKKVYWKQTGSSGYNVGGGKVRPKYIFQR